MADEPQTKPDRLTMALRWVLGVVAAAVVLVGMWLAFAYAETPAALRHPAATHYHFRMQIINDGKAVNFGDAAFQTAYSTDVCTAALTKQPVHFHDGLDQFVHIHWDHMTGGIVLKNYGWNFIGGTAGTLGYRFDALPKITRVPIHGDNLPKHSPDAHFYVYTGDAGSYQQRNWDDFLKLDLRSFFGSTETKMGFWNRLVPAAYAHGGTEAELTRLNDVLGSVVIFAQKDAPTDAQIKDRFNHLIALPDSTCGG